MILVLFSLTHKRRLDWAQQGSIVLHRVLQRGYFQSHSCLIKIFVPLLSEQLQISRNWFSKPTLCWYSVPRYLGHHASVKFLVAVFGSSPFFSFASAPFPFPFDAQFTLLLCRTIWWILIDSDDLAFGSALLILAGLRSSPQLCHLSIYWFSIVLSTAKIYSYVSIEA